MSEINKNPEIVEKVEEPTEENPFKNQVTFEVNTDEKTITVLYYAIWTMCRDDYVAAFKSDYKFGEDVDMKEKSLKVEMGGLPHRNGTTINLYWNCNETEEHGLVTSFSINHEIANYSPNWDAEFVEGEMGGRKYPLSEVELPEDIEKKIFEWKEAKLAEVKTVLEPVEEKPEDTIKVV